MNPFSPHFWMKRMSRMRKMLLQEKPDVICFQEMRWPATLYIPRDYFRVSGDTSHPIYLKRNSSEIIDYMDRGTESFMSSVSIFCHDGGDWLVLYNVHLSCNDAVREEQLEFLSLCTKYRQHVLICGDFNATQDWVMPNFSSYLHALNNKNIETYTNLETGEGACIDHFIGNVDKKWCLVYNGTRVGYYSDHYPVILKI